MVVLQHHIRMYRHTCNESNDKFRRLFLYATIVTTFASAHCGVINRRQELAIRTDKAQHIPTSAPSIMDVVNRPFFYVNVTRGNGDEFEQFVLSNNSSSIQHAIRRNVINGGGSKTNVNLPKFNYHKKEMCKSESLQQVCKLSSGFLTLGSVHGTLFRTCSMINP